HSPEARVQLGELTVYIDIRVQSCGCFKMLYGVRCTARTDQRRREIDAVLGPLRLSLHDLLPRLHCLVVTASLGCLHCTLAQQVYFERAALFLVCGTPKLLELLELYL